MILKSQLYRAQKRGLSHLDVKAGELCRRFGAHTDAPAQEISNWCRAMQAEKSYNGGHWKNIKNRYFQYVGIGVYKYSGRVRLVEDFYRPA